MADTKVIDVNKLSITSIDQIMCFNNANECEFIMDEIQDGTISNTQEKTDITGKGGRKIGSLKKNKGVTVTATNGFVVGGALAAQTGTDVEQGKFKVRMTDTLTLDAEKKAKTHFKPVGTVGNEIGVAYRKNPNGSLGEKFTQNTTCEDKGNFTYTNGESNEICFCSSDNFVEGDEVVVFYDVEITSAKISNDSEKYSKTLKMYIDVTCQDNCDNLYHGQFQIERADFSGEFELAMGGDPTVHNIEAESLAGGCSGSTKLWDFIVYGDTSEVEVKK